MTPLIAADGAGSMVRRAMTAQLGVHVVEDMLEHGYKELTLPAGAGWRAPDRTQRAAHLATRRLHADRAAEHGRLVSRSRCSSRSRADSDSFAALDSRAAIDSVLRTALPRRRAADAGPRARVPRAPGRPHGHGAHRSLGRERAGRAARRCRARDRAVPRPGHERLLRGLLRARPAAARDWRLGARRSTSSRALRKPNTDAIAAMALENFLEMRDTVRDPKFLLRKELSFELERRFPDRFIPRYSMVMFHHEIPYRGGLRARANSRPAILRELTEHVTIARGDLAWTRMDAAVLERLEPLPLDFACDAPLERDATTERPAGPRCLRRAPGAAPRCKLVQDLDQLADLVRLDQVRLEPRPQRTRAVFVARIRGDRHGGQLRRRRGPARRGPCGSARSRPSPACRCR